MAIHAHSTAAPIVQPRLLRGGGTVPCRVLTTDEVIALTADASTDDPRSADELLEEIRRTIEGQEAFGFNRHDIVADVGIDTPAPELPPEPLLQVDVPHGVASDQPAKIRAVDDIGNSDFVPNYPDVVGVVADHARTIHLRRQLAQAAEHGAALLAALGLPRLVDADFVPLDPTAIGDAIDLAIATLDAVDGDTDIEEGGDDEPSLAWTESGPRFCGDYQDREHDTADCEPSLASPERHPTVPGWSTHGLYVDRGPDSSQLRWAEGAQHDGEAVNEDGDDLDIGEHDESDKEPSIGWPNDYRAVLSDALQADHDPEHVNEDGDDCGDEAAPWWDRIGYPEMEDAHV